MGTTNLDSLVLSGTLTAAGVSNTGTTSLPNGTAAAPALFFTNSATTGFFRSAANILGVSANGVSVGTFDANGFNGAVGGTTPAAVSATTLTTSGNVQLNSAVVAPGNVVTGITAHSGGGQASATALTGFFNRVDTVAVAADSVALPAPTFVGQEVVVVNNAATNSMQVFGSGTDTINGVATATGVAQAAGKMAIYKAATTGAGAAWFRLLSA